MRERRDQLRHPRYSKPELLADGPNQVWSWDITKLLGPGEVDLLLPLRDPRHLQPLRRRLDGGAPRERRRWPSSSSPRPAREQGIAPGQLTIHADRGPSMTSQAGRALLLPTSASPRPTAGRTSPNDNPFSEAQFKTLKYRPDFPERFGVDRGRRSFCQAFFPWYNAEHRHERPRPAHAATSCTTASPTP